MPAKLETHSRAIRAFAPRSREEEEEERGLGGCGDGRLARVLGLGGDVWDAENIEPFLFLYFRCMGPG